uniref:Macaca fascicularis brain cDNA clone: QflA-17076, similar to human sparc/osteonectin, cwcv and kazal-like domainsproteoglycan (testican) 2 (SPOCK2), mRNA, RefSeq: NM_014767.1 n=1 Tax=Macaca fascicularis TaxID=9541 RepID=I7G5A0_MACFA|nr:unnamed protein product [Macaca fascicularis]
MGTQASRESSSHPFPLHPILSCPAPPPLGDAASCRLYLPITQPKETSTLHTCIKEIKCYF